MTREEVINIILSGTPTLTLLGLAKEFEGEHPQAHKRVIDELSKRPGALNFA